MQYSTIQKYNSSIFCSSLPLENVITHPSNILSRNSNILCDTIDFSISNPWRTVAGANHVDEPSTSGNEKVSHIRSYRTSCIDIFFPEFLFLLLFFLSFFYFFKFSSDKKTPHRNSAQPSSIDVQSPDENGGFTSGRVEE